MSNTWQDEIAHFGIKKQVWGIRRYQNQDGSLTPEGRERYGVSKYENDHSEDTTLKKGTTINRWVRTPDYADIKDSFGQKAADTYRKNSLDNDLKKKQTKYMSVDGIKNQRQNGKDFYASWFLDNGWQPENASLVEYTLTKDINVASGKKVMETMLDEYGSVKLSEALTKTTDTANNGVFSTMASDYTRNTDELFDRVNEKLQKQGYDAIEDVNDPDTDMPIILFNSTKNAKSTPKAQTGEEYLDALYKKQASHNQ